MKAVLNNSTFHKRLTLKILLVVLDFDLRAGKEGWSLQDLLADFHLLLFLCDFLDLQYDIPQLCRSIMQRDLPLDDGYQLIIRSVAGIDM